MNAKDILKQIGNDPELVRAIGEAMGRNANLEELSGILTGAGVDTATVDDLLAEYQRERGAVLSVQELDEDELDKVAGGGTGNDCSSTDDCDRNFKYPLRSEAKRCDSDYFCDEYYKCDNDWSCTSIS